MEVKITVKRTELIKAFMTANDISSVFDPRVRDFIKETFGGK